MYNLQHKRCKFFSLLHCIVQYAIRDEDEQDLMMFKFLREYISILVLNTLKKYFLDHYKIEAR